MYTYSPSDVKANVLGFDVTGYAEGTFLSITPDAKTFSFRRAMDGSTMAVQNKFQTYTVKFVLQQSSPTNTWLHLIYKLFKKYGIAFIMPVLIRDASGNTSFFATDCWFEGEPESNFGSSLGVVEWIIKCNDGSYTRGGNGDTPIILSIIAAVQAALAVAGNLGVDLGDFESALSSTIGDAAEALGGLV
jgi:hypothetical protein